MKNIRTGLGMDSRKSAAVKQEIWRIQNITKLMITVQIQNIFNAS